MEDIKKKLLKNKECFIITEIKNCANSKKFKQNCKENKIKEFKFYYNIVTLDEYISVYVLKKIFSIVYQTQNKLMMSTCR